jgi:N-acetylmuramoyl-L-alanine amidase
MGASAASERAIAFPSGSSDVAIYMNGDRVLEGRSRLINSVTYVGVRDFCELVGGCDISWDARTRTAVITKGTKVATLTDGDYYIYEDGRCFYTVERIRIISDTMFVPVRAIAKALGVEVGWDNATRSVTLKNTGVLPVSADKFYNADDLYWLSRIISAEAKGESLLGQIAVGNVVLNRKASRSYPNTIYGVIFDRKNGTQFSPTSNGMIYNTPNEESIIAAKICLEGYSINKSILYFVNPYKAPNSWVAKNRPLFVQIGNHAFYY